MKSKQTTIPLALRDKMAKDPKMSYCALYGQFDHVCDGRTTWEHAIIVSGKRCQKPWAIIPLCAKAHEVDKFQDAGTMNKELNEWIALSQATDEDLLELFGEVELTTFSKSKIIFQRKKYLISKYGEFVRKFPSVGFNDPKPKSPEEPIYLTGDERAMIKGARDHHYKNEGVRYNERAMLREMIRTYRESLEIIKSA